MNQFSKEVSVRKVLVIFGVFFLLLQIPTGNQVTKSSNKQPNLSKIFQPLSSS